MQFLHSKRQFKAVVKVLHEYLKSKEPRQLISESELIGVLLHEAQLSEGNEFASGITRLTNVLNAKPDIRLGLT